MEAKRTCMPQLMRDDSDKDGKAEIVMDYVLSWCFRRADAICKEEKPILYSHCRYILAKLLCITLSSDVEFRNVKVWKENQNIDLWVELELKQEDSVTKHAILIENKYYSKLHDTKDEDGVQRNQLYVYKRDFDAHYSKDENSEWQKHYALITCIERTDKKFDQYKIADEFKFNIFSFYELVENDIQTESDIFNEFWYRWGDASF